MLPLFVGWGCGAFDRSSAALFHPRVVLSIIFFECLIALVASVANILRMDKLASGRRPLESVKSWFTLIVLACDGAALGVLLFALSMRNRCRSRSCSQTASLHTTVACTF